MKRFAEVMIVNASLWSGVRLRDADTIAIAAGRVIGTGRASDLAVVEGSDTLRIDAAGATVTPGLTDAHLHLVAWARSSASVDLHGCGSLAEVVEQVRRFAAQHPELPVVVGRGWEVGSGDERPERAALDRAMGDRPVLLHSRDFHNLWVSGAALRAAGIDRHRADPPGGLIERDADGEPTGWLRENAVHLFQSLEEQWFGSDPDGLRSAARRLHEWGVTAVHDFEGAEALRTMHSFVRGPHPKVRVLMSLPHAGLEPALAMGTASGLGDDWLRLGALKLFADGTLGSRTAALLSPYDGTGENGSELMAPADLRATVRRAFEGGLSVAIHAIGDRACRTALDAFEESRDRIPALRMAPRVEHAQLVDTADLRRFSALGVAASMQPVHCTSDIELAERYWGSRRERAYPWRSLFEAGALLAFGSDAPVERPSAADGLHAAVTRERPGRPGAFVPGQRLDLDTALRAYVEGPARLAASWPRLGTLRPGATADLVVWNTDLHQLPGTRLGEAHPVITIVEGDVVYAREGTVFAPLAGARTGVTE